MRFSQPHALALVDVDGDGLKDIITGKRYWAHNGHDPNERDPRVIYWFKTQRDKKGGVSFVPHLMDSASGVGTQLTTGDVNGDGWWTWSSGTRRDVMSSSRNASRWRQRGTPSSSRGRSMDRIPSGRRRMSWGSQRRMP